MSRKKRLSRLDVLDLFRAEIERVGSLRKYATYCGVSAAYLSDVMRGKRDPGPKLLQRLGLSKHITSAVIHYEVI